MDAERAPADLMPLTEGADTPEQVLAGVVALAGTESERRATVLEVGRIYRKRAVSAPELQSALDRVPTEDTLSARQYFELGEVSTAGRLLEHALGLREDAHLEGGPFAESPRVHLSAPRVELFVNGGRDALGDNAYEAIERHVVTCDPCASSVADARRAYSNRAR